MKSSAPDDMVDPLTLPLDQDAIQRLLPHRFPFLFVDRIVELEPDRRIVGVKVVALNDRFLTPLGDGRMALSRAVLTEAVAQVGAIMVLARPENRDKLVVFMGIERVRYRRPVCAGDVVSIEVVARRFRGRSGQFAGTARVDGQVAAHGVMTFAMAASGDLAF